MKTWTALAPADQTKRWEMLSGEIKNLGVANEYRPWPDELEKFADVAALDEFDHVRLLPRLAPKILQKLKIQSSWITLLGVFDGMSKTSAGWWPACGLYEAFGKILIEIGKDLDLRGGVLIAGAGAAARTAIAAFSKVGFEHFLMTNLSPQEAEESIQLIKRKFFGIRLEWLPLEKVVLLPGECSVLVNCTPPSDDNRLITELSYMNFLKRPGFVFDLGLGAGSVQLSEEARAAAVSFVGGNILAAHADVLWAKWAFNVDLKFDDYVARLEGTLV